MREKGKPDWRGRVRERGSTFFLDFPTIRPSVLGEARGKVFLVTRAASRDRNRGVSTNSRGRYSPNLITFYPKGCVVVFCPQGECLVSF